MAIDPTARVADGARIGASVEIGPYCLVGPRVELKSGVRLVGHVNITGATTIGEKTIVYPFSSLGTPPQSVRYRGGETKLVIGAAFYVVGVRLYMHRLRQICAASGKEFLRC